MILIMTSLVLWISDTNSNDDENDYDIIILNTHIHDISGLVARKVRNRVPHKRIILTTTYSLDNISNIIDSTGIKSKMCFLNLLFFRLVFYF